MKIIAITDETSTCECCGKTNLKRVVVLEKSDGSIVRYGTDCAAKATGRKAGEVKGEADAVAYAQKWLVKYADRPEVVARGVWNKFGYLTEIIKGVLNIGNFAYIKL